MNHIFRNPNENIEQLFQAILSLQDTEECRAFFSDLCTMQELVLLSQRLQVAKLLLAGETYEKIRSQAPSAAPPSPASARSCSMAPADTVRYSAACCQTARALRK